MNIWEFDKLIVFILFVIPGFVSLKGYELLCPGTHKESSKQIIDAVAYSCINYALLFWLIKIVEDDAIAIRHPILYAFSYLFVLFIAPLIWVLIWKYIRSSKLFQNYAPHPTLKPWDYVFSKRKPYWVKIILKDGKIVAGKYGAESFTSSAPAEEQIYLEETWILKDNLGFERPKKRSAGVIVMSTNISHIEFSKYEEEKENEQR